MSVDPSYQVILNQRAFGSGLVDSAYTGFTKYNQHIHQRILPRDPRWVDIREGDVVYVPNKDGEAVFPEDTTVIGIYQDRVEVSQFANVGKTDILYLLKPGEDPINNTQVLDNARRVNQVSVVEGESSLTLETKESGFLESSQLKTISYSVISGSIPVGNLFDLVVIPEGFYSPIRLYKYKFLLIPNTGNTLQGELSIRLVHQDSNSGASDILDITLNSDNEYELEGFDLEQQNVIKPNDRVDFVFGTNTAASSQTTLDLEQFNSLGEIVREGLGNSIGSLSYWLEFIEVV